jgi:hypothetical protein
MYTWDAAGHVPYDGGTPAAMAYLDTTLRFVSNFLYDYLGCTPSDPDPQPNTVYTVTGVTSPAAEAEISASNPSDQWITIRNTDPGTDFTVFDATGRKMLSESRESGSGPVDIPSGNWPNGLYIIHYESLKIKGILKVNVCH